MHLLDLLRPTGDGSPDWDHLLAQYGWARAMADCPQDPEHHAEGDVWTHTRMVCEELAQISSFKALSERDQIMLSLAALLHDVGKPSTTREEDGRIRSPGHSVRGEIMARRILWEDGAPFSLREQVCSLIRFHQQPFHLLSNVDAQRRLFRISVVSRCDHLALLAEADARGRICNNPQSSIEAAALFREYAEEQGVLSGAFPFPSDLSRFLYFQKEDRNPFYEAHDDTRGEMILLSGLPGTGKSTWIEEHTPDDYEVVGLDETRAALGLCHGENEGRVRQETVEQAKRWMGAKQNPKSFIWNATNISRVRRAPLISLAAAYNYRVRIVYLEVPPDVQDRQNRDREKPVPADAMEGQLRQWEVPDLTEAVAVDFLVLNP